MDSSEALTAAVAVVTIMIATLKIMERRSRRRSVWTKNWIKRREEGRGLLSMVHEELAVEDKDAYKNFMRMTEEQFQEILGLVRNDIEKENTTMRESISPEKRLALTLRFLATGETYRSLMYATRIHHSTISQIIPEVCTSIYRNLKDEYMKVPRSCQEWEAIAHDFDSLWNFPMCLGAMDGKHIAFRPPSDAGSLFYNYKGSHSIVLLAVVDAKYKFIYVDVGTNGRISDGGVYRESSLSTAIAHNTLNFPPSRNLPNGQVAVPYVFVADDAFPLSTRIMKPYPSRDLSEEKRIFNYRLSRARRVVENAFGILSNRFRIFLTTINLSPDKVDTIVLASVALHNYLCTKNGARYTANAEENCGMLEMPQQMGNRATNLALRIREEFKNYFCQN